MKDKLFYVNTNKVIDCVWYRVAVLRKTQCGSFTYFVSTAEPTVPTE